MKNSKCISFIWKLFSLVLLINLSSAAPEVTIAQGRLQGKTVISERGFSYDAFMGIPYAKPPVGDLRFKDPQPADGWEGIRSATAEGNFCPQVAQSSFIGNEDCLYLNVFVPQNTSVGSNLPSIVWIHGGSYISGSGSTSFNGLDNLMDKDVIIVTINYRLGPLGFLCLHSADVPGNAGMQDQVLALKWVQENIGQFGGDAYQVTIFGESAGGSSVHFLMMSPATNGLFSKAIMDSGTSISEWALQPNPVEIAVKLGRLFSLDTENKTVLFNLFKTLPASLLVPVSLLVEPSTNALAYTPVIEELHRPNSFLEDDPMELLRSARYNVVPTISGFMSNEGAFFGTYFTGVDLSTLTLDILIPNFEIYIPKDLKDKLDADAVKETAEKIKQFYFETEDNLMERYFTFWTDYAYVKDIDVSTKFLAQYDPRTYYFKFSYSGTYNYIRLFTPIPYEGAAHADELGYIFNYPKGTFVEQPTETDDRIVKQMAEMWTNFAKFGNPTPALSDNIKVIWEPVSSRAVNCLDINNNTVLIQNPYKDRAQFWQDLYLIK